MRIDSGFHFFKKYNRDIVSFAVSNIGNYYLLTKTTQLTKLMRAEIRWRFNEVQNMANYHCRSRNPWRTFLYYKNFLL